MNRTWTELSAKCNIALMQKEHLSNNYLVTMIRALDKRNPEVIANKMHVMETPGKVGCWIWDFLMNRSLYVTVTRQHPVPSKYKAPLQRELYLHFFLILRNRCFHNLYSHNLLKANTRISMKSSFTVNLKWLKYISIKYSKELHYVQWRNTWTPSSKKNEQIITSTVLNIQVTNKN